MSMLLLMLQTLGEILAGIVLVVFVILIYLVLMMIVYG
jgi:hypothetical protein